MQSALQHDWTKEDDDELWSQILPDVLLWTRATSRKHPYLPNWQQSLRVLRRIHGWSSVGSLEWTSLGCLWAASLRLCELLLLQVQSFCMPPVWDSQSQAAYQRCGWSEVWCHSESVWNPKLWIAYTQRQNRQKRRDAWLNQGQKKNLQRVITLECFWG